MAQAPPDPEHPDDTAPGAIVLLSDGYEGAIAQHYLWGFMLIMLAIYGPGSWSVDGWLARKRVTAAPAGVTVSA